MNFEEFKSLPSVTENLPHVAQAIDDLLTTHLIETCAGQNPDATTAEAQAGASKSIANIIKLFRSAARPVSVKPVLGLKPLNRSAGKTTGEAQPKSNS